MHDRKKLFIVCVFINNYYKNHIFESFWIKEFDKQLHKIITSTHQRVTIILHIKTLTWPFFSWRLFLEAQDETWVKNEPRTTKSKERTANHEERRTNHEPRTTKSEEQTTKYEEQRMNHGAWEKDEPRSTKSEECSEEWGKFKIILECY